MATASSNSQYEPDVLLVFVGYSQDGREAADVIVGLEAELQRELDKLRRVNSAIPFRRVKVWEWENDAAAATGGQAAVVTPELSRANLAVFVFNERVGRVTWEELHFVRDRKPPVPILPFFPANPPINDRMMDVGVADSWTDLLRKKRELASSWMGPHSKAVTPLPTYQDHVDLARLACERLKAEIVRLLSDHDTRPSKKTTGPGHAAPKRWSPYVVYPLQPAPHFAGRRSLLQNLSEWAVAADDPDRVVSLVAAGGTGKTAIAERLLASLADHTASGVFVWSFYENPNTAAFLRDACRYFVGKVPKETGGLLEHLQHGLRTRVAHLLIFDGLELVQSEGSTIRTRGELENPLMRRFLRWLAAGHDTRTKALITSRFPVADLSDWNGQGYRPVELKDLDLSSARAVLRKRGVKGTDEQLGKLANEVHRHALTVDVLGLYLSRFGQGDPKNAPKFNLNVARRSQKGAKLARVLESYARKLPADERDLLARLSLFPRGATVADLEFLIKAEKNVSGALHQCERDHLIEMLDGLCDLGLVFASGAGDRRAHSAHPFLRDFFRTLLGRTKPEDVYRAVLNGIEAQQFTLEERPGTRPTDPEALDYYERLIEYTRLAGERRKAIGFFVGGLGHYGHLGRALGEYARGLRILSSFSTDGTPRTFSLGKNEDGGYDLEAAYATIWGMFAANMGDLATARQAFDIHNERCPAREGGGKPCNFGLANLIHVELYAGRWPAAAKVAAALSHEDEGDVSDASSNMYRGVVAAALGRIEEARRGLLKNEYLINYYNYGIWTLDFPGVCLWPLEFLFATGDRSSARARAHRILSKAREGGANDDVALLEAFLGRCLLPDDIRGARRNLKAARRYAGKSGNIEVTLRCYHLAAEIGRYEGDYARAISEALEGIQLADSCGFGRWSIDIRTELARCYLASGDSRAAIGPAEWILKRSRQPDCQYAWGIADSLHLLGIAHARLNGKDGRRKAIEYLSAAIDRRKSLGHPGLDETEAELALLQEA
jgi:hypothetical protein